MRAIFGTDVSMPSADRLASTMVADPSSFRRYGFPAIDGCAANTGFGVHQGYSGLSAVCITADDSFGMPCLHFGQPQHW
jgi:hypothetical protein